MLAYGNTWERGLGNGWEGQVFTLGNGVQQKVTEDRVAVGAHYRGSRHTGDTEVTWYRSRSGQPGTYWLQSIDFSEIWR